MPVSRSLSPRPRAAHPRLHKTTAYTLTALPALLTLALLALMALTPRPAHAQWYPCDANGNLTGSTPLGNSPLIMSWGDATLTGSTSAGTSPANVYGYNYEATPWLPGGGTVAIDDDIIGPGVSVFARNGGYYADDDDPNSGVSFTGTASGQMTVTLKRYFLWQPSYYDPATDSNTTTPPPGVTPLPTPTFLTALLNTQLLASAGSGYLSNNGVYPAPVSGLSASASVTDDQFGETASATAPSGADASQPWPIYLSDSHQAGGLHLIRAPVTQLGNGAYMATVTLSGQTQVSASDGMADGMEYRSITSALAQLDGTVKIATTESGHWEGPYYHTKGLSKNPLNFHVWPSSADAEGFGFTFDSSYNPEMGMDALGIFMKGTIQPYWKWVLDGTGSDPYAPMAHHHAYAYVLGDVATHAVNIAGGFIGSPSSSTTYDPTTQTWSVDQQYDFLCSLVWAPSGLEADGDAVSFDVEGFNNWDLATAGDPPGSIGSPFSTAGFVSVDAHLFNTLP